MPRSRCVTKRGRTASGGTVGESSVNGFRLHRRLGANCPQRALTGEICTPLLAKALYLAFCLLARLAEGRKRELWAEPTPRGVAFTNARRRASTP